MRCKKRTQLVASVVNTLTPCPDDERSRPDPRSVSFRNMRAAVVSELDGPPRPGELADPSPDDADVLVEIEATPLNPIDLAVVAGRNPAGHPALPFVPAPSW
jgi:hypothetical protein